MNYIGEGGQADAPHLALPSRSGTTRKGSVQPFRGVSPSMDICVRGSEDALKTSPVEKKGWLAAMGQG